jgi:YD repeat-containing protein
MKAPTGGEFLYVFGAVTRSANGHTYNARVVTQRTVVQDGDTPAAGWTFTYNQGIGLNETQVHGPSGWTIYEYNGIGTVGPFEVWRTGTLRTLRRLTDIGPTSLAREAFTYTRSEPLVNVAIGDPGDPWYDDAVYRPLLSAQTVTRDAGTSSEASWTTSFEYHWGEGTYNDYGQPWRIWQSPSSTAREIRRTFVPPSVFTPYLVGRVQSEDIRYSDAAGHFLDTNMTWRGYGYAAATGFMTSTSVDGVATTFTPTARGNVGSATNARSVTTTFDYAWGAVSRVETPLSLTVRAIPGPDAAPTSETVGKSPDTPLTTTYAYDAIGRLTRVTPPGSTGSEPSPAPTIYGYDDAGTFPTWTTVSRGYSNPTVVTTVTDAFGRVRRVETSGGGTAAVKTAIRRDGEGREVFRSAAYTGGQPPAHGTRVAYDALDRVTKVENGPDNPSDPDYSATTYAYAGARTTVTDPKGYATRYEYAFLSGPGDGRLLWVQDATNQCTYYRYRLTNTLTSAVGPGAAVAGEGCPVLAEPPPAGAGPLRTWTYTSSTNRLAEEQHPESGLVQYSQYDAVGNVTEIRKRRADGTFETTALSYDVLDRPLTRTTAGSSFGVTWAYDTLGRTRTVASDVTTTYGFDPATGRPTSRTDSRPSPNGWTYTSSYAFDGRDRLTTMTYPNPGARQVGYGYDDQGRVSSVTNNGASFAADFQYVYEATGLRTSYVTGAVTQTVRLDKQDRTDSVTTAGLQGPNVNVAYTHDRAGNVASLVDAGVTETFGYDALHRLTSAAGPWGTLSWDYDPTGNRLREDAGGATTLYSYNSANRLAATTSSHAESFTYDGFGRLIQDSQGTYTYRPDGAPLTAARTGMNASYVSDAEGLRVERTVNGQRIVTARGAGGQVLSEFEADGCAGAALVWRRDLIYAGSRLLGSVKNASARPSVAFAAASSSVAENAGSAPIAVQLTTPAPLACPVSLSYQTHDGSAKAGQDYTTGSGTVTFPAGSASGATLTVSVGLLDDLVYEGAETLAVTLATPIGADLGAASSHTLTIMENEAVPSLSVADVTVAEGPGASATFAVTLSAVCGQAVSVTYATANGTATAGQDYTAPPRGAR